MASAGLALSPFTNLDQELAPEYSNPLAVPVLNNGAAKTEIQPLPISIPNDTVTLSATGSQRATYQPPEASLASAVSDAAPYSVARANRNAAALPITRSPQNSQSSTTSSEESPGGSATKPAPEPPAAPRESAASQNEPYQPATQTTQQSLLQLDRTLQQIGVNPQHTSLIRRVALVRLANDPPALGEYFGPSSSAAASASAPESASKIDAAATKPSNSKPTPDTSKTATEATRQTFLPQGKRLNVSV